MAEVINVNELKPGMTFIHEKEPWILIESEHSKSGRGQAHVKCKAKNLMTGTISTITYTGGDKLDKAFVERRGMQYLYIDGSNATFMDNETFEQIEILTSKLEKELKFIIEGSEVSIMTYEGMVLGIDIPKNVELEVAETADAVKGDTVTNATKKAILETGLEVDVPQFIDQGQKIIINTTTGKYGGKV